MFFFFTQNSSCFAKSVPKLTFKMSVNWTLLRRVVLTFTLLHQEHISKIFVIASCHSYCSLLVCTPTYMQAYMDSLVKSGQKYLVWQLLKANQNCHNLTISLKVKLFLGSLFPFIFKNKFTICSLKISYMNVVYSDHVLLLFLSLIPHSSPDIAPILSCLS